MSHAQLLNITKGPNSSIRKQRVKSSTLPPDFHSREEREVCRSGSTFLALRASCYKPRLLLYCSFGHMCCVCEINVEMWKSLHNTPPPLSPSQTLWLLWISSGWGEWRHEGWDACQGQFPAACGPCNGLITASSVLYLCCSHHALGSTEKYKEKPSVKWLPQFNQDVSHGCLPRKCKKIGFSYGNIVEAG